MYNIRALIAEYWVYILIGVMTGTVVHFLYR